MARKRGHHRLKPEVSPITYIILGAIFVALTLAIIFSIDTKNQKFTKSFALGENNYNVTSLKKVTKNIEKGNNELVIFYVQKEQNTSPKLLIEQVLLMYNKEEVYENISLSVNDKTFVKTDLRDKVKTISFVEIGQKEFEKFSDFVEKYELKHSSNEVLVMYFENKELKAEANLAKQLTDPIVPGGDKDLRTVQENLKQFMKDLEKKLYGEDE